MSQSFQLIDVAPKVRMSTNRRVIYFLVVLLIVLPILTGVLVWHFMPKCDKDDSRAGQLKLTTEAPAHTDTSTHSDTLGTTTVPFEDGPWKDLRLPRTVIPVHYVITLYPDFYGDNAWFYGNETVEIDIKEETKHILIHVNFLNITSTRLEDDDGNSLDIHRTFEYKPNQFLVVETTSPIPANKTVYLHIQFDGSLTRSIVGLYKSVYTNSLTKEKRYSSKTYFRRPLKKNTKLGFKTNHRLMQVKSIAECSKWSILQYF